MRWEFVNWVTCPACGGGLQTAAEELQHGINEHLPRLIDYLHACRSAGLQVDIARPSNLWAGDGTDWAALAQKMGARWCGWRVRPPAAALRSAAYYLARRLAAVVAGPAVAPRPPFTADDAAAAQVDILHWCGGELFLLAHKPKINGDHHG